MLQHIATRSISVSSQTSFSFDDVPLGDAASDRYIIVAVSGARTTGNITLSNITIAGASTTEIIAANETSACCAIRRTSAPLAVGATGQIVVTFSNASRSCHLDVYSATRLKSPDAYDTNTGITTSGNTVTASLDIPRRGAAIAAAFGRRSANNDWRGSAASDSFPGGALAHSITPLHDATGFHWTGLVEDSDTNVDSFSQTVDWMLLAAASFEFQGGERVFGAVMG